MLFLDSSNGLSLSLHQGLQFSRDGPKNLSSSVLLVGLIRSQAQEPLTKPNIIAMNVMTIILAPEVQFNWNRSCGLTSDQTLHFSLSVTEHVVLLNRQELSESGLSVPPIPPLSQQPLHKLDLHWTLHPQGFVP